MERVAEFLYLELGVWSEQILAPKMRLSERQVEEDACTPPEHPGGGSFVGEWKRPQDNVRHT